MYQIDYSEDAKRDLKSFRKFEQKYILDEVDTNLQYEPHIETRNRKRLDPNEIADWECGSARFAFCTISKRL